MKLKFYASVITQGTVVLLGLLLSSSVAVAATNVWSGGTGIWQTSGALNWDGGTTAYLDGNAVSFNDTASTGAVNLQGTVNPSSIVVSNSVLTYVISGSGTIGGGTSLVKLGTKPLTLTTSNSFTGGVYLTNGGTLYVNNSYALGATNGGVFVSTSSILEIGTNGFPGITVTGMTNTLLATTSAFRGSTNSSGSNVWAGPVILGVDGLTISTEAGGNLTISGSITAKGAANYGLIFAPGANGAITLSGPANVWNNGVNIFSYLNGSASGKVVLGVNNGLATGAIIQGGNGILDLHGYNQTCQGVYGWGATAAIENDGATPSTLTLNMPTYDQTCIGPVRDGLNTLNVVKTGVAKQTLSGVNTYSGTTLINGGTLALSGSGSISNTALIGIGNGAGFNVSGRTGGYVLGSGQTLSNNAASTGRIIGNLNASAATISVSYLSGTAAFAVTNGTLTLASGTVFKINNIGLALIGGNYPIISTATGGNVGLIGGSVPASFTLTGGGLAAGCTASLQTNSAGLNLVVSGAGIQNLVWSGGDYSWQTNGSLDWNAGTAVYREYTNGTGDYVVFDDTTGGTVNIPRIVNPSSITVNNTATNYLFSGSGTISGTNGLVKLGTGTLTLGTSNNFTGGVTIGGSLGGRLLVNHPNALGATISGVVVSNNNTLEIGTLGGVGITVTGETVTITGSGVGGMGALQGANNAVGSNVWAGPVILAADKTTIGTESGGNLTISGNITTLGNANYGVILAPGTNGTVTLSGSANNWQSGSSIFTDIQGDPSGKVVLGINNALPTGTLIYMVGGAKLDLHGYNQTCIGIYSWLNTNQFIENDGAFPSTLTLNAPFYDQDSRLVSLRDGTGKLNLVKSGAHTQTLRGTNAYTGSTSVSGGTLAVTLPMSSRSLAMSDGTTLNITVNATNWAAMTSAVFTNVTLGFNCGAFRGTTNPILIATNLVLNGNTTINFTGNSSPVTNLTLLTYGSKTGGGALVLGSVPAGVTANLIDNGSSVSLQLADSSLDPTSLLNNSGFESGPFLTGWTANGVVSITGLNGSATAATFPAGAMASLSQQLASPATNFTAQFSFQIGDLDAFLQCSLNTGGGDAVALRISNAGVLQAMVAGIYYNLTRFDQSGAYTNAGVFMVPANQTVKLRVIARGFGTANANYDLAWSEPSSTNFTHAVTGLKAFASPATMSYGMTGVTFLHTSTWDSSFTVDDVTVSSTTNLPPMADYRLFATLTNTTVVVDYSQQTSVGHPELFGGGGPYFGTNYSLYGLHRAAGVTIARMDAGIHQILYGNYTTIADYKASMTNGTGVADPNNWNWQYAGAIDAYHNAGFKTLVIIDYCPQWLSYTGSGDYSRPNCPSDWVVWQDIVKKFVQHFQGEVDYYEIWNEPEGSGLETGTPYGSASAAYVALYTNCVAAIRTVDTNTPIGGYGGALSLSTTFLDSILSNPLVASNFNFASYHAYSAGLDYPGHGSQGAGALWRTVMANHGLKNIPICISEHNAQHNGGGNVPSDISADGYGFCQKMREGVQSSMLYALGISNPQSSENWFYSLTTNLTLTPRFAAWRLMSNDAGLGAGNFKVYSSDYSGLAEGIGVQNINGDRVAFLVNDSTNSKTVNVVMNNLGYSGSAQANIFEASATNDATSLRETRFLNIATGNTSTSVTMPPWSVVSVNLLMSNNYAAWAAIHAGGQGAGQDYNQNGVPNGLEYFYGGAVGPAFTMNPLAVSWPHDVTAVGATYKVFSSPDLINWTDVTASVDVSNPVYVKYNFPISQNKYFVRLQVAVGP